MTRLAMTSEDMTEPFPQQYGWQGHCKIMQVDGYIVKNSCWCLEGDLFLGIILLDRMSGTLALSLLRNGRRTGNSERDGAACFDNQMPELPTTLLDPAVHNKRI